MVVVVSGSRVHARFLGGLLALNLGARLVTVESKRFPDGELYVRLSGSVEGEDVLVVTSTEPPQNDSLVELMLLVDSIFEGGARSVSAFIPYLPYARQDRVFLPGEPVSVRAILRALYNLGVRRLVVVEAHSDKALSYFPGEVINVNPLPYMARVSGLTSDVLVVSPDLGGVRRATSVAEALGARCDYIVKRRDRVTGGIEMDLGSLNPKGLDVVIVDDVISTGGTVAEATRMLLERGARSVRVLVAHNLNLPGALDRIRGAGVSEIIASNTLPQPEGVNVVDVTPLVVREIAKWWG